MGEDRRAGVTKHRGAEKLGKQNENETQKLDERAEPELRVSEKNHTNQNKKESWTNKRLVIFLVVNVQASPGVHTKNEQQKRKCEVQR